MAILLQARKRFVMGPNNTEVVPGDVIDLADPGWHLPHARISQLVEYRYGVEVSGESITKEPGTPPAPAPAVVAPPREYDHKSTAPPPDAPDTSPCPHCERTFPSPHGLKVHLGREHKNV